MESQSILIDLQHLGNSEVVASCLLVCGDELALVDPGPSTTLVTLRAKLNDVGVRIADIRTILLTHIHLDHAGGTGTLVRENPKITVVVHEKGAIHMVDPAKLLNSARRLYGPDMDRLWGELLPVPRNNIRDVRGGERIAVGKNPLEVIYTPGHASHHVSYFDVGGGTLYVGDVAGVRISNQKCILPVTPPPDIDIDSWHASLNQIVARNPTQIFLTHFGVATNVAQHVDDLRESLRTWSETVRKSLNCGNDDSIAAKAFGEQIIAQLHQQMPSYSVNGYIQALGPESCWYGLARYWRKRETQ